MWLKMKRLSRLMNPLHARREWFQEIFIKYFPDFYPPPRRVYERGSSNHHPTISCLKHVPCLPPLHHLLVVSYAMDLYYEIWCGSAVLLLLVAMVNVNVQGYYNINTTVGPSWNSVRSTRVCSLSQEGSITLTVYSLFLRNPLYCIMKVQSSTWNRLELPEFQNTNSFQQIADDAWNRSEWRIFISRDLFSDLRLNTNQESMNVTKRYIYIHTLLPSALEKLHGRIFFESSKRNLVLHAMH